MKSAVLAICACLSLGGIASGQVQQTRHAIENGEGYEKPTRVYEAKAPYVLKWHAEKSYNPRYKYDPGYRAKETSCDIHVYDAATNRIIKTAGSAMDGEVYVPVAGRHYLRVFALGKWETWMIEKPQESPITSPDAAHESISPASAPTSALALRSAREYIESRDKAIKSLDELAETVEEVQGSERAAIVRRIADDVKKVGREGSPEAFVQEVKRAHLKLQDAGIAPGGAKPSSDPQLPAGVERQKQKELPPLEVGE